ncbi:hypothetical protein TNCV_4695711 [Trichonephila clavipes]|nr:hypothetical protein TNCV_4695711 [Trichonephila clavipes]
MPIFMQETGTLMRFLRNHGYGKRGLNEAGGIGSMPSDIEGFPMKGTRDSQDNKEWGEETEKDEQAGRNSTKSPLFLFEGMDRHLLTNEQTLGELHRSAFARVIKHLREASPPPSNVALNFPSGLPTFTVTATGLAALLQEAADST